MRFISLCEVTLVLKSVTRYLLVESPAEQVGSSRDSGLPDRVEECSNIEGERDEIVDDYTANGGLDFLHRGSLGRIPPTGSSLKQSKYILLISLL